jgi:hypothetical protein
MAIATNSINHNKLEIRKVRKSKNKDLKVSMVGKTSNEL